MRCASLPPSMQKSLFPSLIAASVILASLPARGDDAGDPYLWLEDVQGKRSLGWVKKRNQRTEAELARTPAFKKLERQLLAIYDSDEKIPYVEKIGPYYYNFWKDAKHERGLWRRATLEELRKPKPRWETVLDLDALNKLE